MVYRTFSEDRFNRAASYFLSQHVQIHKIEQYLIEAEQLYEYPFIFWIKTTFSVRLRGTILYLITWANGIHKERSIQKVISYTRQSC